MSLQTKFAEESRWRYWSSGIALAIVFPILVLGLIEGGLRLFGVGDPTSPLRFCTAQGHPAACNNVFFTKPFFPAGMIRAPHPFSIPAKKDKNTFRIFVLGESAAYGDPDPAYGFSRYLEVMLRRRFPETKFEVVNASATAINSHVLLPMAKALADQQPDLFIIYMGNNEVVGPYGPGTVLTAPAMSLPVIRAGIMVRSTRIGQLMTKLITPKSAPQEFRGMEMFLDKQVRADSPLMLRTYSNFEANLRGIVSVVQKSGAKVVLSTVATNLRDCAPFASSHKAGLSAADTKRWEDLVSQGAALQASGSYAEALKLYLDAAQIDDTYAELHFRIATCFANAGDYQSAYDHYLRAQDLDTLRFRADSEINGIIRSVANANANAGVSLIDAQKIFAGASEHQIPGSEFLWEHVHLKPSGNYLLATSMLPGIENVVAAHSARSNAPIPTEEECEQRLALTEYDRSREAGEMLQRVSRPPFTNQLTQKQELEKISALAQPPTDSFEQTVAQYRWAIGQNPDDHLLHLNLGLLLYDFDRAAATREFRNARPYDDIPFVAPDGTLIR